MPILASIPSEDWYGAATPQIKRILGRLRDIRWFSLEVKEASWDSAVKLVEGHLYALRALGVVEMDLNSMKASPLSGPWAVLHRTRWGQDPYNPWGNRWKAADESIGRLVNLLRRTVESNEDARTLLRPPLWPLAGHSNVCGEPLVATLGMAQKLDALTPDARDRCVAWGLLCKADLCAWHTLLFELAVGAKAMHGPNPFDFLLQLYELGFFPMGSDRNQYDLYMPDVARSQPIESDHEKTNE